MPWNGLTVLQQGCITKSFFSLTQDCWNLQPSTTRYLSKVCCHTHTHLWLWCFCAEFSVFILSVLFVLSSLLHVCPSVHSSGEVDQTNRRGNHWGPAAHWGRRSHRGNVRLYLLTVLHLLSITTSVWFTSSDCVFLSSHFVYPLLVSFPLPLSLSFYYSHIFTVPSRPRLLLFNPPLLLSAVTCAWWCEAFRRWTVKLSPAPCWEFSGKIQKPGTSFWHWSGAEEDEAPPLPPPPPVAWGYLHPCVCVCMSVCFHPTKGSDRVFTVFSVRLFQFIR